MGTLVGEGEANLHIVCIPYPAQGHIKPMLQVAKLLHAQGFHITFVLTEYNLRRLSQARGPNSTVGLERFKFEAIPDGLPTSDADVTQDLPALCHSVMTNFLEPFKKLLCKLNDVSSGLPRVTAIVSDVVMPFTLDAAHEIGNIPVVWFWSSSVCGFLGYSQFRALLDSGIVPFKDSSFLNDGSLDKVIDDLYPSSLQGIPLKYIPSLIRTTDKDEVIFNFLMHCVKKSAKSTAPVIFNTFDTFEHEVLEDTSKLLTGPMYTIGPLQLQLSILPEDASINSLGSNLWKEDSQCLKWLDSKRPKSVVYVSFGSITTMTNENLVEFAWGLANSNHPFLWVLRPDLITGDASVIPPEFLSETKERGLITSWCDQESVLKHSSVGVFLTHCGWNSMLETVCGGVPVLCWPFFAEQQTNCWFSTEKWRIGMEIDSDVKREEVENQVKELMEDENGKEMGKKAMEWKMLAEEANETPCGSSYLNFNKLIKKVFLPLKTQARS